MATKVIVIGAVYGKFKEVFQKLSTLHEKNQFSLAVIIGDLFPKPGESTEINEQDLRLLVEGRIEVPLPTYFALGKFALPEVVQEKLRTSADELCENLFFLGKRSTMKTSEGVKIVTLGGTPDVEQSRKPSKDKYSQHYSLGDASALHGAHSADILVTSDWPENVMHGSKIEFQGNIDQIPIPNAPISDLCSRLRPRYHFSTSEHGFFEREPFFHPPQQGEEDDARLVTRFISLAPYANPGKRKWLYAFSIELTAPRPLQVPAGTTISPFVVQIQQAKGQMHSQSGGYKRYAEADDSRHHRSRKRARPPPGPDECFFCLSNPNVASHLITSIGSETYLTTAKGPLTTTSFFPILSFSAHAIIIPLAHAPTLSAITPPDSKHSTILEMQKYRDALNSMLASQADRKLGSVTWEVCIATGIHAHWQIIPVARDLIDRGLVEAAFKVEAENKDYPVFERCGIDYEAQPQGDHFRVWIWLPATEQTEPKMTSMALPLDSSFRFDVQFGRRVMAKLLGLESRISWQDCTGTEEEETVDTNTFKEAFQKFDFTLDE